jgi:thioredoxin 1
MENSKNSKNKLAIKIVLPIILVLIVGGIWFVKNNIEGKGSLFSPAADSTYEPNATPNPDLLLEATEVDLEQLKSYGLPIIIDFGADSCIPCKEMAPVLKKLNEEWQGKIIVKFVDVWKYPEAVGDFPIQLIPTQFFFDAEGRPFVPDDPEGMGMQMFLLRETNEHVYTAHQGGMTEDQIRSVFEEMGVE